MIKRIVFNIKNYIKHNCLGLLFCFIVSVLFCLPYFSNYIYRGYDLTFHLNRFIGVADSIRDHQFLVKIYPYSNNGFGVGTPLFYSDIFIYPFAILYMLGVSLVNTCKIMVFAYTLIGNLLMYYCMNKVFKSKKIAIIGMVLFGLAGYKMADAFTRASLSEYISLCFMPLFLYAFYKIFVNKDNSYILLGLAMAISMLSHVITFILVMILAIAFYLIFIVVNRRDRIQIKNTTITIFKAIVIGFLLTAWYTLPFLEQILNADFFFTKISNNVDLSTNLLQVRYWIYPFTKVEDFTTIDVNTNNILGYVLIVVPLFSLFMKDRLVKIITIIGYFTLLCGVGIIPIYLFKPMGIIQFSFRLYTIITPFLCISSAFVLGNIKNKLISKVVISMVCVYTLLNVFVYNVQIKNNINSGIKNPIKNDATAEEIFNFTDLIGKTDFNWYQIQSGEALPYTEKNDYLQMSTYIKRIENGLYDDAIYDFNRYFSKIDFEYDGNGGELLMMPLSYYKGYKAYADNENQQIDVIDVDNYHMVGIKSLSGNHSYHIYYGGTMIQHVSLFISLSSFLCIVILVIKKAISKN